MRGRERERDPLRTQSAAVQPRSAPAGSKGTRARPLVAGSCKGMWGPLGAKQELGGRGEAGGARGSSPALLTVCLPDAPLLGLRQG